MASKTERLELKVLNLEAKVRNLEQVVGPNAAVLIQTAAAAQTLCNKFGVTNAEILATLEANSKKALAAKSADGSTSSEADSASKRPAILPTAELGTDSGILDGKTGGPETDAGYNAAAPVAESSDAGEAKGPEDSSS